MMVHVENFRNYGALKVTLKRMLMLKACIDIVIVAVLMFIRRISVLNYMDFRIYIKNHKRKNLNLLSRTLLILQIFL